MRQRPAPGNVVIGNSRKAISAFLTLALLSTILMPMSAAPFAAEGAGTIRGTLVDRAGQPLSGYKVRVIDATGSSVESQITGPDGSFEIPDIPAGTYTYEIIDPQGNTVVVKIPPVALSAGTVVTQPIAIIPSDLKPGSPLNWAVPVAALGVLTAIVVINNNNDDDDDDGPPPMTGGGGT